LTAEIINIRDFKRREENDADLVRLAKEVMGLVDLPTRPGMDQLVADSWAETAPCEMPPVQPDFTDRDPA
jgi:hypothetical protein